MSVASAGFVVTRRDPAGVGLADVVPPDPASAGFADALFAAALFAAADFAAAGLEAAVFEAGAVAAGVFAVDVFAEVVLVAGVFEVDETAGLPVTDLVEVLGVREGRGAEGASGSGSTPQPYQAAMGDSGVDETN